MLQRHLNFIRMVFDTFEVTFSSDLNDFGNVWYEVGDLEFILLTNQSLDVLTLDHLICSYCDAFKTLGTLGHLCTSLGFVLLIGN